MATKVVMEALSPTMEEGRLVEWKKGEGEPVAVGDVLAEVETDKAVMELVARAGGTLLKQVVPAGTTVPVSELVALIGDPGEAVENGKPSVPQEPATQPAPDKTRPASPPPGPSAAAQTAPAPRPDSGPPCHLGGAGARGRGRTRRAGQGVPAGAPDRRGARHRPGRDRGLGPGRPHRAARSRGRDGRGPAASGGPVVLARPPARPPRGEPQGEPYSDVPLSQIRKTIAKRLVQSIGPIPTFYLTTEVDMERAWDAREALKALGKVSFNDIIIKAVATALRQHPACNAWWQDDHIRYWHEVHVSMAVAIEEGLITPVIRHADLKSLRDIAAESQDLAARARDRRLAPEEYTGGTFSVSNLGMLDIDEFTAVINPPEAGILAVGRIVQKPVAHEGQVAIRRRLRLTMSCDHRVIDGATGARFLQTLTTMLENPLALVW